MKTSFRWSHPPRLLLLVAVLLGLFNFTVKAHTLSTSYLTVYVTSTNVTGEWHLALRDLEDAVGLDSNDDGAITWAELLARKTAVSAYALSRLHIGSNSKKGTLRITGFLVDDHSDGAYSVLRFEVEGITNPASLEITYNAFFDIDPKHRGLLRLEVNNQTRLGVFAPDNSIQTFDFTKPAPRSSFFTFLGEGVWHIWSGYDHILFLMALLLPGVLVRHEGKWVPVKTPKSAFLNVFKIVTAFTVAHSITLTLSALGFVYLPTRLIESIIAATVVLAGLNNLFPFFAGRGWMVAFAFGLLHGFGFANALRDLGLHGGQLAAALFGFNLGVEVGQLAIVAFFLPFALSLRSLLFYRLVILQGGSIAIIAIASAWFAQRAFDFKWLPF